MIINIGKDANEQLILGGRRMKFKRIMSLGLISALIAGTINIPVIAEDASGTDVKNYNDYVKGEMPASIMKWLYDEKEGAYRTGIRGWYSGTRNSNAVDTDNAFDAKEGWTQAVGSSSPRAIHTLYPITGDKITQEGEDFGKGTIGGDGMASNVYIAYDPGKIDYVKMDNSKNYVFKLYIKDNHPGEGEAPLVNFAISNENTASRTWSKEYGAEGFRVTGEYQAYAGTFDLVDAFNNDGKQVVSAGFMIGNGAGESISFRTKEMGDVYLAEEVAYDIKNEKTSEDKGLFAGDSATFEAQILNQIGSEGYLDQNVEWLVLDESRSEIISGFTVETDESTKKATVTVGDAVQTGTYVVVAYSEKYDMAKGQEIKVYDESYYKNYVPGAIDDNLLGYYNQTPEREFQNSTSRNLKPHIDSDKDLEGKTWGSSNCFYPKTMKVYETLSADVMPGAGVAGLSLCPWKPSANVAWFQFDKQKTYVLKLDIKDNYPDETPVHINASISNETEGTRTWSKEYGAEGIYLTGDYKTYGFTFEIDPDFNIASNNAITVGFLLDNAVGESFSVDTSTSGKIYFAEEKAHDVKFEKVSGPENPQIGNSITFEASVVNQIGSEGYLTQDFDWYVMDADRKGFVDGFEIEVDETTKRATVRVGDTVSTGRYDVVAVSDKYGMAKGQTIKVYDQNYYKDYVKGEKPASIMRYSYDADKGEYRSGERGWMETSRNSRGVNTDRNFDGNILKTDWGTAGSYSPRSIYTLYPITGDKITQEGEDFGYGTVGGDGMASVVYVAHNPNTGINYVKMDNSKNYVFSIDIKDNHPGEGEAPLVNFAISNDNVAGRAWSKEYGAEGFRVTGEWQTYAGTFDLPDTFRNDGVQTISSGFMIGNGAGESIAFKTSNLGDIYLAEEVDYDITNTKVSGPEKLQPGLSATFEASVVNQIGSEGYLTQDFDWYVMDTDRKEFIDGFEIEVDETTKRATVTVGDTVSTGRYDVVAVSDDYGMVKGQTIRVVADDYYEDYQVKAAPANIYETIYGDKIVNGIMQRNSGSVNVNQDNAPVYNFFASADASYSAYNGIDGWITNKHVIDAQANIAESYNKFEVGKTYLFKIRAKDASTNGKNTVINAIIHNENGNGNTHNWPLETPGAKLGQKLTSEYQDYIFTIPVGENFDVTADRHFLTFGFSSVMEAGAAFDVDFSVEDSVYLAEEVVYDIKNTVKAGQTTVSVGGNVTLEASVVNQLDKEGSLEQNFAWVAMDTDRRNIIEGITVTPSADTTEAIVTVADTVAVGTYAIVAVSEDYDIARGINIDVVAAAEKISALELIEDSGYVMLNATVVDSTAEKIFFVLAAYAGETLSAVKSIPVDVVDGVATTDGQMFDDALASGTTVKAFIWNYGTQDAIDNPNNFDTSLIVQ